MIGRLTFAALLLASTASAQNMTTQAEVQPILDLTRANWVALGTQTGNDLLYFSHLLALRCGIAEIRYGLNGAEPATVLAMEPCYREITTPNSVRELPFLILAPGSVESLTVELVFPDGEIASESFERAAIRLD